MFLPDGDRTNTNIEDVLTPFFRYHEAGLSIADQYHRDADNFELLLQLSVLRAGVRERQPRHLRVRLLPALVVVVARDVDDLDLLGVDIDLVVEVLQHLQELHAWWAPAGGVEKEHEFARPGIGQVGFLHDTSGLALLLRQLLVFLQELGT